MGSATTGLGGDAPVMLGLLWGFTGLTLAFVLLRLYTRIKVVQSYGLDDHFFNASFACLLAYDAMLTLASFYGFGRDMTDILALKGEIDGMEAISRAILYSAIGQTILVVGTGLSKTSLALFLLRIGSTRRDKIAIWVPNFFLCSAIMVSLFVFWFACRPISFLWDRRLDGKCDIDPGPISTYAGSWSVIVDFWYAAFPWWMLWGIQMPKKEKWLITSSMSLGVFAGACGIKRAIELTKLGSPNYTKDVVGIIIWHAAELATTMACIGIPVCRPLYKTWITGWGSSRRTDDTSGVGSGWMKKKDDFSDSVFAMHTIGGTDFSPNNSSRSKYDSKHDEGSTEEDEAILRGDAEAPSGQATRYEVKATRPHDSNGSEESILGGGYRRKQKRSNSRGIVVKTELQIEEHRVNSRAS